MILTRDCRDILPTLDAESVDCCVTSPPYALGLRNYGNIPNQIGLEATLEKYIETIRDVFREVHRVLKPEGTLWLNLGDKYNDKSLLLIPAQVAISLKKDGWILRNEIIWAKTNPMPSSAPDRCTNSHEIIYLFVKQQKYFFDRGSISEPASTNDQRPPVGSKGTVGHPNLGTRNKIGGKKYPGKVSSTYSGKSYISSGRRNKWDVWTIPTAASENSHEEIKHYAKYPEALVRLCILAGCPVGGTVLDPFSGSGTTGKVAHDLGREYIGIELNPAYAEASEKRIGAHLQTLLSPRLTK